MAIDSDNDTNMKSVDLPREEEPAEAPINTNKNKSHGTSSKAAINENKNIKYDIMGDVIDEHYYDDIHINTNTNINKSKQDDDDDEYEDEDDDEILSINKEVEQGGGKKKPYCTEGDYQIAAAMQQSTRAARNEYALSKASDHYALNPDKLIKDAIDEVQAYRDYIPEHNEYPAFEDPTEQRWLAEQGEFNPASMENLSALYPHRNNNENIEKEEEPNKSVIISMSSPSPSKTTTIIRQSVIDTLYEYADNNLTTSSLLSLSSKIKKQKNYLLNLLDQIAITANSKDRKKMLKEDFCDQHVNLLNTIQHGIQEKYQNMLCKISKHQNPYLRFIIKKIFVKKMKILNDVYAEKEAAFSVIKVNRAIWAVIQKWGCVIDIKDPKLYEYFCLIWEHSHCEFHEKHAATASIIRYPAGFKMHKICTAIFKNGNDDHGTYKNSGIWQIYKSGKVKGRQPAGLNDHWKRFHGRIWAAITYDFVSLPIYIFIVVFVCIHNDII